MAGSNDSENGLIRIRTDYIGAGTYLLSENEDAVIVNTDYGVQAIDVGSHELWQADFGERCLGLCRREDGILVANTLHAVYQIASDGNVRHVNPTLNEIAYAPVPWQDGVIVITLSHVYALDADGVVKWKFAFSEALGESVRATMVLNAWTTEDGVMLGAVDYNSGVGRVVFLGTEGELGWASEVAPMTDVFPVEDDDFIYTISAFPTRFESHRASLDGTIKWKMDFGGSGLLLPDGRVAMLVGNNESPKWDNWELRLVGADGSVDAKAKARGHCVFPPALGADGQLYFAGYFKPFDPTATRLDYTSLTPLPKFLAFDHLMGHKAQPHQFLVYYFRSPVDELEPEMLFEDKKSMSFGPTVAGEKRVYFTHNRDILAYPMA